MAPIAAQAGLRRLSPPVWRILLHSLLFGLALSVADILFNFYLASMGYAADTAGLLSTVSRGSGMVIGIPMGLLMDRLGAQRAILLGLGAFCAGWALLLTSRELWVLLVGQFVVGAAYLLAGTAVTPLLTSVTRDSERARVFGLNASATLIIGLLGSVVGGVLPTMAGWALDVGPQDTAAYRLALGAVIALGVAAMLPVIGRLPQVEEARPVGPRVDGVLERLPARAMLRFAIPAFLLGIGGGLFLPFQNLFFRSQFGLDDATVGVILAVGALGAGVGALLGASVTARLGLKRGAAALRFGAVGAILLLLPPLLGAAVVGFFLRGLFVAASFPQMDALAMRHTPPAQRGAMMSTMSVLWSGGWAISALISGYVQITWGFGPILVAAAVAYVLSSLAILALPVPDEAG
jgi:MFS family permease